MLKITKRAELTPRQELLVRLGAIALALIVSAIVMALLGVNPLQLYKNLIEGAVGSPYRFRQTLHKAIPLTVLSLGVGVAFRMKFWNIGAEGQMLMGAFGASFMALFCGNLPAVILLPAMMLAAALCGGIWALIPALLKSKFGTSETLVTLMLNYIAFNWITYLQYGPWRDPSAIGFPKIANFLPQAVLPTIGGVHLGIVFAPVAAALVHLLIAKSKLGYEISVLGESEATARYAGINVFKVTVTAMLISGGLCGFAGMMQASAIERTLNNQIAGGLGFTAVISAWLAQLSAPATVLVSFLFACMLQGGAHLQSAMKVPATVSDVLLGTILFFVLGCEFFIRYKVQLDKEKKGGAAA